MSAKEAVAAIESRFAEYWLEAHPSVPVAWENVSFVPPENAPWVRFNVALGDEQQMTFGGDTNTFRLSGVIFVSVFVPKATGMGLARTLAETARSMFRAKAFGGVNCRAASVSTAEEDNWASAVIRVPFWVDANY